MKSVFRLTSFWLVSLGLISVRAFGTEAFRFQSNNAPTLSPPFAMAQGDFNQDGNVDLAVVNFNSAQMSVLMGSTSGQFLSRNDFPSGNGPSAIASADFNLDGKPDVVVVHKEPMALSVFIGTGQGGFAARTELPTTIQVDDPEGICAADFNGDGKPDLAFANRAAGAVSLLPGNGAGGFFPRQDFPVGNGPLAVRSGDFNKDGRPDLAVTIPVSSKVVVLLGNSAAQFVEVNTPILEALGTPYSLSIADINADTFPDVVTAGEEGGKGKVGIHYGNGTGVFHSSTFVAVPTIGLALSVSDFNGDGHLDVAAVGAQSKLYALANDGGGRLGLNATFDLDVSSDAVLEADFNRDGRPDLAIGSVNRNLLQIFLNITPAQGLTQSFLLPIVLSSSGANNSVYTTELSLTNRGSRPVKVTFVYRAVIGEGSGTATTTLGAGSMIEAPAIAYLRTLGIPIPETGNRGGTLRVIFSHLSASNAASVQANTTTVVPGGRAGLSYPGIKPSQYLHGGAHLIGLRQNAQDRSNVALLHAGSDADGPITLSLSIASGLPPFGEKHEMRIELAPGEFRQLNSILSSVPAGWTQGHIQIERVSGSAPYYAYGIINDQITSDGSFVEPVVAAQRRRVTRLVVPAVVESGNFQTELVLANTSAFGHRLYLTYSASAIENEGRAVSFTIDLEAGEQRIIPNLVNYIRLQDPSQVDPVGPVGPTYVGPLFISSMGTDVQTIFVSARTSTPPGSGRFGLAYPALPSQQAAHQSTWLYGLRQDSNSRSNLAVVHEGLGVTPLALRIELFDGESGAKVATLENVQVSRRGFVQLGSILAQHAPGTTLAYALISKLSGDGNFFAYAVINDGATPEEGSSDGVFVSMQVDD